MWWVLATAAASRSSAAVLALALALAWFVAAPPTPDLAAAAYRAGLFAREGFQLYDSTWFGGHHLPGYSVLAPVIEALLGVRVTGVLAAVGSAVLFERLATNHWGKAARPAVMWFAAATVTDLMIGRITFGIGVTVGLAALLALQGRHTSLAAALAVACSATSPVAGAFLALACFAVFTQHRGWRAPAICALAAGGCVAALAILFPEGGAQPFAVGGLLCAVVAAALIAYVAGDEEPVVRRVALLYCAAALAAFLLPTPMGSNLSRLGAGFAGPVLLAMLLARPPAARRLSAGAAVAALALFGVWQWVAPVREVTRGIGDPSYRAAFYAGMLDRVEADAGGRPVRIEIPFTRSHWEAVHVARRFSLARGWQTQLDRKFNALFFADKVDGGAYRTWLQHNAVAYVALPDVPLDPGGRAEARLIEAGQPYLQEIWSDENWRLFRVRRPSSLAIGSAELVRITPTRLVLDAPDRAATIVRVRWTRYWVVESGGCVSRAGEWTRVQPMRPGRVTVRARFAVSRAAARTRNCSVGARS